MRWRIEFIRKGTATKAGQIGRRVAVEVTASDREAAIEEALSQVNRQGRGRVFEIDTVRKL